VGEMFKSILLVLPRTESLINVYFWRVAARPSERLVRVSKSTAANHEVLDVRRATWHYYTVFKLRLYGSLLRYAYRRKKNKSALLLKIQ